MTKKLRRFRFLIPPLCLVLFLVILSSLREGNQDFSKPLLVPKPVYAVDATEPYTYYYPLVFVSDGLANIEMISAWTNGVIGEPQGIFYLGDTIQFISNGENYSDKAGSVALKWSLAGPCGTSEIFNESVSLPAGPWQHVHNAFTPECAGSYTASVQVDYFGYSKILTTNFQVHLPSQVVVNTQHGFDRCWLPTVGQMQTWWNESPYDVWNIYLGGVHYFCPSSNLTPAWVQTVAQQGWKFILTWVGPQPPCSQFTHKFSSNPLSAFSDGIDEAAAALAAAESLGISGEKIIYYDLEFYPSSNTSCNDAVNAFLEGWTVWLQLQGDKSGVYASPCNSNIKDWINISPPPDDVWIAHWIYSAYDPAATVWNVACSLPNTYWGNHQRIRQYAGDHTETWGGVSLTIDSDVLDGEVTAILGVVPTAGSSSVTLNSESTLVSGVQIREFDLISQNTGWLLLDDRLLLTEDNGVSWRDITPDIGEAIIQDADFVDRDSGWLAAIPIASGMPEGFEIYHTRDSGATWEAFSLPVSMPAFSGVDLEFVDDQTGWAMFKVQTGSSFSVGRLFATQDGGVSWEERTAPLGESVVFVDGYHGWMVGGPAGNQIYRTQDGGLNWQPQDLPDLPGGQVFIGQPVFETPQNGVLPVTLLDATQSNLLIYSTADGGDTWWRMRHIELSPDYQAGAALPFAFKNGRWWAADLDSNTLLTSVNLAYELESTPSGGLPAGVADLDFVTAEAGWALVQDNQCYGDKTAGDAPESSPFYCYTNTRLYQTRDCGRGWEEVPINLNAARP